MAEVLLFHHVQGLTPGILAFADALRAGGHTVHTPDLFSGELPASIEEGMEVAGRAEAGLEAAVEGILADLPAGLVYGGWSWGVMTAQRLAQTRLGARGGLFYEAFVSLTADWAFGPWPGELRAQVHGMDRDPFFAEEGDLDAAREAAALHPESVEVFTYDGTAHLFTDSYLPGYDAAATALVIDRSLEFLDRLG